MEVEQAPSPWISWNICKSFLYSNWVQLPQTASYIQLQFHKVVELKSRDFTTIFGPLPRWYSSKISTCQCRRYKRCGFVPLLGRSPGVGNGNLIQYSCLENPKDRGARQATVHESQRVGHDWTRACARAHTHTQDISRGAEWCTFFLTSNAPTYNLLTQILGLPEEWVEFPRFQHFLCIQMEAMFHLQGLKSM